MYEDISLRGVPIALASVNNCLTILGNDRTLTVAEQKVFAAYLKNEGFLDHVKIDPTFVESVVVGGLPLQITYSNGRPVILCNARVSLETRNKVIGYLKSEGFITMPDNQQDPGEALL